MYCFVAIQYMELACVGFSENFKACLAYVVFALKVCYSFSGQLSNSLIHLCHFMIPCVLYNL